MSTRTTRLDLRYEQQKCHNIIVAPSRTAILFSGVLLLGVFKIPSSCSVSLSEVADRGFPLFLQAIFGSGCSEFGDCNLAICQVRARRRGAANPGRNPASAAQMKSLSNQPISLLSLFSERHYLAFAA